MADERTEGTEQVTTKSGESKFEGKNPILVALLLLNAILMGVIAYLQFTAHQRREAESTVKDVIRTEMKVFLKEKELEEESMGERQEKLGILFPLKGFTANLAHGDGPRRFVRVTVVLKFSTDSKEEEFKSRRPQIRDKIISILNSKRPEDLLKIEGKNYLKEEIKAAINTFLIDGRVIDVFYVGFQIN